MFWPFPLSLPTNFKICTGKDEKDKSGEGKKWACRPVTTKLTRNECDSSRFFFSNVFLFFFFSHLSSLGTFHSLTQLHQKSLWSRRRLFRTIFKINSSTRHDFLNFKLFYFFSGFFNSQNLAHDKFCWQIFYIIYIITRTHKVCL